MVTHQGLGNESVGALAGRRSLILGGVKSGKSRRAQQAAEASGQPVTLIATATAGDAEMQARIQRHRQERPADWHVVEEPIALADRLQELSAAPCIIIDCLTLWMTNLLLLEDEARLREERGAFEAAMSEHPGRLILVSNETSLGIVPLGRLSRRFADESGLLHQAMASRCDEVILMIAGLEHRLKPTR